MSVSLAAIAKKVAVTVATNKKARKAVVGIVLGAFVFLVTPIVAVLSIFTGNIDMDTDRLKELISEQQIVAQETMRCVEEEMTDKGCSQEQIDKAYALYSFALYPYGKQEDFAEKLANCFDIAQSDSELVVAVNAAFGTSITDEEFANVWTSMKENKEKERDKFE